MSIRDLQVFYSMSPAERLREHAATADAKANAARADNDALDERKWREQAREFRRLAREKEFPA